MNTTKHQFNSITLRNYDDDTDIYEAKFPIADDGGPKSNQWIRMRVFIEPSNPPLVELVMISQTEQNAFNARNLGNFRTENMDALACLLYGAACLKTKQYIEKTSVQKERR